MEMRRGKGAPRYFNAFSSTRDSRSTSPRTEQQILQNQDAVLRRAVQTFSSTRQVCGLHPLSFTINGPRPVEEVAKDLVGHFLICRESNVVMRIVETEAYTERERDIFRLKFPVPQYFRRPAGTLVRIPLGHFNQHIMLITTGAPDSPDVVLLRACSAEHGNREIAKRTLLSIPSNIYYVNNRLSGPTKVYLALEPDFERNCSLLDSSSGFYLVQKDPNPVTLLDGPRILPRYMTHTRTRPSGFDSRLRFAYDNCTPTLLKPTTLLPIVNQP